MFKKLLFVIPLVLILAILTFALDDQGNPNDPTINDRANACYEDGTMANKCDTEWEWICGWYMIRFDYGIFSREEIPASCSVLLPGEPEQDEAANLYPTAGCIDYNLTGLMWVDFNGGNFINFSAALNTDSMCIGVVSNVGYNLVYAPNGASDARALCIANGFTNASSLPAGYNPDIYRCT